MSIEEIINLLSTNGFAVVMCILMFRRMNSQDDKLLEIVTNNTQSITKLCEKIDRLIDVETSAK